MKKCMVFELNSSAQNEFLTKHCLEHKNFEKFKQMLEDRMPLTAFMLNVMLYFDYGEDDIKEVLKVAKVVETDVIPWMTNVFEVDELSEILTEYDDLLPNDYPSDDDCVRLKLWKTLLKRQKYQILAQYAPDILEKENFMEARLALLRADIAKYADKFIKKGFQSDIAAIKDGWKYLIDFGQVNYVLKYTQVSDNKNEILDYCLDKGLEQEIYDAGFVDFLLKHKKFEILRKNHCINRDFLRTCHELVDWEGSWKVCKHRPQARKTLLAIAREFKDSHECMDFLKNHGTWWDKFWL